MSLFLLPLLAQAAAAGAPLASDGKWTVDYAEGMCALSHAYGVDDHQIILGIRPNPFGSTTELILIGRDIDDDADGKASVILSPSAQPIDANVFSFRLRDGGKRAARIFLKGDYLEDLANAFEIIIEFDRDHTVRLAPRATRKALAALDACQADLLRSWKIDPEAGAAIAKPAEAIAPETWFTVNDYPLDALRAEQGGLVVVYFTIGLDGRVTDCSIGRSSGSRSLDDAACRAISERGRFVPATDKEGDPIVSWSSHMVTWRIPE